MCKDKKNNDKFKWNSSSKQSKYYYKSSSEALEYSQSDELESDELEDKSAILKRGRFAFLFRRF